MKKMNLKSSALSCLVMVMCCAVAGCVYIIPLPSPDASFEIIDPDGHGVCELPCEVHVNNKSNLATTYEWTAGNGRIYRERSPVFVFLDTGTYEIQLTVANDDDERDTAIRTIRVVDSEQTPIPSAWAGKWEVICVNALTSGARQKNNLESTLAKQLYPGDVIAELDEYDNSYAKTINVLPQTPIIGFEFVENRYVIGHGNNWYTYGELYDHGDNFQLEKIGLAGYAMGADNSSMSIVIDGYEYELSRVHPTLTSTQTTDRLTRNVWLVDTAQVGENLGEYVFFSSGLFIQKRPFHQTFQMFYGSWSMDGNTVTARGSAYEIERMVLTGLHLRLGSDLIKMNTVYVSDED